SITSGQSSVLSWSVTGATGLSLDPGGVNVTGQTSRSVAPTATTAYTLTATNSTGGVTRSVTVTVTTQTPTPTPTPPRPSSGPTFYVSPTGSDTNPGTQDRPFRTIQKAADVVNPGYTVIVEDGVYTFSGSNQCSKTVVCLTRGGGAGQLVTFKAR